MSDYKFRIKFILPSIETIASPLEFLEIVSIESELPLLLKSHEGNVPLSETNTYLLIGEGFSTKDIAQTEGIRAKYALMWCSAKLKWGVDVGNDKAATVITNYFKDLYFKENNIRILDEVHGLMVYNDHIPTQVVDSSFELKVNRAPDNFLNAFKEGYDLNLQLTARETLAFELYSSSHFTDGLTNFNAPSRYKFLTLVITIESLIEPEYRADDVVNHVDKLIELTKNSKLEEKEISSLLGSLRFMRKESISQAGKRLVEKWLGDKEYKGKPAKKFFQDCYNLRSKLVHEGSAGENLDIREMSPDLDQMVSDLLLAVARSRANKAE